MHYWIFDLDDTLHHATPFIFPHLNRLMTQYLQDHLGLSLEEANQLRVQYWHRYGATLSGLIKYHQIDPEHFLWHTHQFDDLKKMIVKPPTLHRTLQSLKGKKYIFSNAPRHYIAWILNLLKITHMIDGVHSLEDSSYIPKPYRRAFYSMIQKFNISPKQATFIEDSPQNLRFAKKLGMRTIWITHKSRKFSFVDNKITTLRELNKLNNRQN